MKKNLANLLIITSIVSMFASCEKTEFTNDELRNLVPGGLVTVSLTSPTQGTFSVVNDPFSTYGCYHEKDAQFPGGDIYFYIRVSGKKNNVFYYFQGRGSVTTSQMDYLTLNPNKPFPLMNVTARINIIKGSNTFFTTHPSVANEVPGSMTISNLGVIGDLVKVNFNFQTSGVAGFSDMTGTVNTRYVISNY